MDPTTREKFEESIRTVRELGEPELAEAIGCHVHVLNRLDRSLAALDPNSLKLSVAAVQSALGFLIAVMANQYELLTKLGELGRAYNAGRASAQPPADPGDEAGA